MNPKKENLNLPQPLPLLQVHSATVLRPLVGHPPCDRCGNRPPIPASICLICGGRFYAAA